MADGARFQGKRVVRVGCFGVVLAVASVLGAGLYFWRQTNQPLAVRLVPADARLVSISRDENDFTGTFEHRIELELTLDSARAYCRSLDLPQVESEGELRCERSAEDLRHPNGVLLVWRDGYARYRAFSH
jgi:hypothetical protein